MGRHNAVDKIKGEALLRGIPTEDRILLSTGRISSEMLLKAARMGVPVVASRTSPTEMAVALAEQLGVTVVGYVRPDGLNLYAGDALELEDGGAAPGRARDAPLVMEWAEALGRRREVADPSPSGRPSSRAGAAGRPASSRRSAGPRSNAASGGSGARR